MTYEITRGQIETITFTTDVNVYVNKNDIFFQPQDDQDGWGRITDGWFAFKAGTYRFKADSTTKLVAFKR